MKELILASASPRRRELLSSLVHEFRVLPSGFEERAEGLSPRETALRFAEGKAREVFARYPAALVLGADTVVSLNGEIFGKPKDERDAARMLRALSGRTHAVITGVCLVGEGVFLLDAAETEVTFSDLTDELIGKYVGSGLCADKAGAYGIQDGYPLVKSYKGSYSNVVGLPTELLSAFLKEGMPC